MRTLVVHNFGLGDVDEPDLYAHVELDRWLSTDKGKWVKEHKAEEITLRHFYDINILGHKFVVTAKLKEEDATFFLLKFDQ